MVVPTFTYVIYGNHARADYDPKEWAARATSTAGAYRHNPAETVDAYGASTYNVHEDGSGIGYATHKRPLLTLKSGFMSITEPRREGKPPGSGMTRPLVYKSGLVN